MRSIFGTYRNSVNKLHMFLYIKSMYCDHIHCILYIANTVAFVYSAREANLELVRMHIERIKGS